MIQDVSDITSFKWATVTGINPLAIRLDGDTAALALIPDSIIDPLELLAGDRVRVELSLRKCVIHGAASGGGQSGEVKLTAAADDVIPRGWLVCRGQSLLRTDYPRLFNAIRGQYGAADSTHFSLPDLRGRVAVGRDANQAEFDILGDSGGAKTHTLAATEIPAHNHLLTYNNTDLTGGLPGGSAAGGNVNWYLGNNSYSASPSQAIQIGNNKNAGGAHNNLQPYITLNYIIKL